MKTSPLWGRHLRELRRKRRVARGTVNLRRRPATSPTLGGHDRVLHFYWHFRWGKWLPRPPASLPPLSIVAGHCPSPSTRSSFPLISILRTVVYVFSDDRLRVSVLFSLSFVRVRFKWFPLKCILLGNTRPTASATRSLSSARFYIVFVSVSIYTLPPLDSQFL